MEDAVQNADAPPTPKSSESGLGSKLLLPICYRKRETGARGLLSGGARNRNDGAYRRDPRERAVRRVAAGGRSHPSQRLRTPYSAVVREFRFLAAMHLTARVSAWTAPAT